MVEWILIALLQAAQPQPSQPPAEQNVDRSEYAEVVATQKDNEEVNPNTVQYCRTGIVTDSRIRRERVCQTPNDRQATRDAFQRRLDVGGWMGGLGN